MSIDKFSGVKTNKADIPTDADYSAYLNSLPEKPTLYKYLSVLGTVAAVIVAVIAVTAWALIGRGVRGSTPASGTQDIESAIYTAVEKDVFSDSNVKSADITVDRIKKVDDSLYYCSVSMDIHFHDEQNITYPLNQTNEYYHNIFPLYIEHKNGEYVVSDNQDRRLSVTKIEGTDFEWELDSGMLELIDTLFGSYGVLAMPLFDEQNPMSDEDLSVFCTYIAQLKGTSDLNKIAYDYFGFETDFKKSAITGCEFLSFPTPEIISYITYSTVFDQWYIEITYSLADEIRVLGLVYRGDNNVERFVFHKRDELFYEGSKGIGSLTDKMLRDDPLAYYKYSAADAVKALEDKDGSVYDEITLGQSMGITLPNIDEMMIEPHDAVSVLDDPDCAEIVKKLTEKCEHGDSLYTEKDLTNYTWYDYMYEVSNNYVWDGGETYNAFIEKYPDKTDVEHSWTVGMMNRYDRLYVLKKGYRYYADTFTEEQLLNLKSRGVLPHDIPVLIEKMGDAEKIVNASDEKLKEIIEDYYKQKLEDILGMDV